MKNYLKIVAMIGVFAIVFSLSACDPVDKNYNSSSDVSSTEPAAHKDKDFKYPEIKSSDTVMSKFIDISMYDEENYSDIYLGKKFKFDVSFSSSPFTVPTTYKNMTRNGWNLMDEGKYDADSMILACETVETHFTNDKGVIITAYFYNSSNSSVKLSRCNIVKFRIENQFLYEGDEVNHDFNINGVTNNMAITDVIDTLGSPSHFYADSEDIYYLDYFVSKDDRRNGITVYVSIADDSIVAVEFSYYK